MSAGRKSIAFVCLLGSVCLGDTIHVPADSPTIQIAIHEAQPFDTIIVAQDTYYEAINFSGKVIVVQSEDPNDPDVVANTIIDAGGLGSVVTFSGGEDEESTMLTGFTITGGTKGIDGHGSPATIRNCVIRDNSSIGISDMDGLIESCTIKDNASYGLINCDGLITACLVDRNRGYGVYLSQAAMQDCQVLNTRSGIGSGSGEGDGMYQCHGHILRCTISRNYRHGMWNCRSRIQQSIISGNGQDGLYSCNNGFIENTVVAGNESNGFERCTSDVLNVTVTGNNGYGFNLHTGLIVQAILWDNETGAVYSSTTPLFSGTTNPFFVAPGYRDHVNDAWIDGDYHLSPDSPYIDAGDPFYGDNPSDPDEDLDGNPRVVGARVDIGAYEFQAECDGPDFDGDDTPDICDADIDGDGISNVVDRCDYTPAGIVVNSEGRPIADMNWDCRVDLRDYAVLQRSFFE